MGQLLHSSARTTEAAVHCLPDNLEVANNSIQRPGICEKVLAAISGVLLDPVNTGEVSSRWVRIDLIGEWTLPERVREPAVGALFPEQHLR